MIITTDKIIAFEGSDVTIFGMGFTSGCVAVIGGSSKLPSDVSDSSIVFKAPSEGTYPVYIKNPSGSASNTVNMVVLPRSYMPVSKLQGRSVSDFALMLKGLLPRGFAWNFKWSPVGVSSDQKTNWQKMLESVAAGLLHVWDLLATLVTQSSPAVTGALAQWESELGLPRKGLEFDTDAKRKDEIFRIARGRGGSTIPHFKNIIDLFGLDAEIYEYWKNPEVFPDWVKNLGDDAYMYCCIKIKDGGEDESSFDCNSSCDDYLSHWWNDNFENAIEFDELAHVKFIYMYE